jgi:hypothetical protein
LTVTADAQSAIYGDTLGTLAYQITSGSLYGSDGLSGALTTAHGGAGTALRHANGFDVTGSPFAITRGTLNNGDYAITYIGANLTLAAKVLTITADNQTISSGTVVPIDTLSYSGFVSGENAGNLISLPVASSARSGVVAAGTYAGNYTVSGGSSDNYSFTYVDGNLVVLPVASSVTTVQIPSTVAVNSQLPVSGNGSGSTNNGGSGSSNNNSTNNSPSDYGNGIVFGGIDLEISSPLVEQLGLASPLVN